MFSFCVKFHEKIASKAAVSIKVTGRGVLFILTLYVPTEFGTIRSTPFGELVLTELPMKMGRASLFSQP